MEFEGRAGGIGDTGDRADFLEDAACACDWVADDEQVESRVIHAFADDLCHGDECEAGCGGERFAGGAAVLGRGRCKDLYPNDVPRRVELGSQTVLGH